jgi:hypothetical protein
VLIQELLLVFLREIAPVRDTLIVVVGHEVINILLEVRAGAADGVHFILTDHFSEGEAELGGAHGAGEGHQHFTTLIQMLIIAVGGIFQRGRVEVAVVVVDKLRNGALSHENLLFAEVLKVAGFASTLNPTASK